MGCSSSVPPFLCMHVLRLYCRHTGVVAYGQEFFYGGMGIESCPPVSGVCCSRHVGVWGMLFKTGCELCT